MSEDAPGQNWKLDLRYGRLVTPYKHFTTVADGVAGQLGDGFDCPPGAAVMTMKAWACDADEAAHMIRLIGQQIGFTASGTIEVYETEAGQPPGEHPYGYDISFVPYDED